MILMGTNTLIDKLKHLTLLTKLSINTLQDVRVYFEKLSLH